MHADRGWSKGVGGWEEEGAPVLAVHVGSVWGAGKDVVPFQDIVFGRVGDYVWRGIGLYGGIFASKLDVDQYRALRVMGKGCERTRLLAARVAITGDSIHAAWRGTSTCLQYQRL